MRRRLAANVWLHRFEIVYRVNQAKKTDTQRCQQDAENDGLDNGWNLGQKIYVFVNCAVSQRVIIQQHPAVLLHRLWKGPEEWRKTWGANKHRISDEIQHTTMLFAICGSYVPRRSAHETSIKCGCQRRAAGQSCTWMCRPVYMRMQLCGWASLSGIRRARTGGAG